jgi:ATP phosphoribosyltransferase regulatory subunit
MWDRLPQVELAIDLADLRGYRYHNGVPIRRSRPPAHGRGAGRALRQRGAGLRARPARPRASLWSFGNWHRCCPNRHRRPRCAPPGPTDAELLARVAELRGEGHIVVQTPPGHAGEQQEFACDRELVKLDGRWTVRPLGPQAGH